jgi:hypothetical protein
MAHFIASRKRLRVTYVLRLEIHKRATLVKTANAATNGKWPLRHQTSGYEYISGALNYRPGVLWQNSKNACWLAGSIKTTRWSIRLPARPVPHTTHVSTMSRVVPGIGDTIAADRLAGVGFKNRVDTCK